jgi:uncharacterized coiled-coil DUF342 family protein
MTYEEIEKTLQRVADSHLVQAELLSRLDQKMDELVERVDALAAVSHDHHHALGHLAKACERLLKVSETHNEQLIKMAEMMRAHEERLVGVEDRLAGVEDQTALLRSTVSSVLQRMDAFIQGLQKGDGHSKKRK